MSEPVAIYKRDKSGWQWTLWNGAAGGEYAPVSAEDDLIEMLDLQAGGSDGETVQYLIGVGGTPDNPGDLENISPAVKKFRKKTCLVEVTASDGCTATVEGLCEPWAQSLANSADVVLAVWPPRCGSLANSADVVLAVVPFAESPTAVWLNEGGREGWIRKKKETHQKKEESEIRKQIQRKHGSELSFINPYSFVPLPIIGDGNLKKHSPNGHAKMLEDCYSGYFDWVLTMTTPLLLPSETGLAPGDHLEYPGSSLRGALRSLHEALSGGCMRILDPDYVPVHRDPMNAYDGDRDYLAVVCEIDPITHAVTKVKKTKRTCWVPLIQFDPGLVGKLYSGMEVAFGLKSNNTKTAGKIADNNNKLMTKSAAKKRFEACSSASVKAGSGWVVHLTRSTAIRDKKSYYVAVSELGEEEIAIEPEQWSRYVDACDGNADLIGNDHPSDTSGCVPGEQDWPHDEVWHGEKKALVGRRRKVDGWLGVGDTVWVSKDNLKMAVIWRSHGSSPVGQRMDDYYLPCSDPRALCPTCAVFGSVRAERSQEHDQASYRTHVHVGWGRSESPVEISDKQLPPLRSPKPSSGGFYLEAPEANRRRASKDESHIPVSHWGSIADGKSLRKIRGRKFYWHGQVNHGRQEPSSWNSDQNGSASSVAAGTILRTRISFDNLDIEQIGWLIAAADPSAFFATDCATHLGGGKPLGYGTATTRVEAFQAESASQRYNADADSRLTVEQVLGHVRNLVEPRGLAAAHSALRRILGTKSVDADRISYPTTESFASRESKKFGESFRWFSNHTGGREGDLMPLPDATELDQYLPCKMEADDA